jgi:hypothetical protein
MTRSTISLANPESRHVSTTAAASLFDAEFDEMRFQTGAPVGEAR